MQSAGTVQSQRQTQSQGAASFQAHGGVSFQAHGGVSFQAHGTMQGYDPGAFFCEMLRPGG